MAAYRASSDDELRAMQEFAVRESIKMGFVNSETGRPVRFDTSCSHRGLRVVFRKLGQSEKEHPLNHISCYLTRSIGDRPPYGNNCHVECVMDVAEGCTVRIGTMYKFAEKNAEGETEWKPGALFVSQISEGELAKYETFQFPNVTRAMETRLFCFAVLNLGARFDEFGYQTRAVWPRAIGGIAAYDPKARGLAPARALAQRGAAFFDPKTAQAHDVRLHSDHEKPVFYCPQLVVICLQAAACESERTRGPAGPESWITEVLRWDAAAHTPNSLYKAVRDLPDVVTVVRPDLTLSRVGRI
jgi:hypothetical protein